MLNDEKYLTKTIYDETTLVIEVKLHSETYLFAVKFFQLVFIFLILKKNVKS